MIFGLINESALGHPCDAALSLFVAPYSRATVLYLLEPIADSPGFSSLGGAARAFVHHIGISARTAPEERALFGELGTAIAVNPATALPFPDASINIAIILLASSWPANARAQIRLLSELRRVLAPSGEVLVLAKRRHRRSGPKRSRPGERNGSSRVARLCRVAFASFTGRGALPDKPSLETALGRSGFKSQEWFIPARSGEGCLTEVRPLAPRSRLWSAYRASALSDLVRYSSWFAEEFLVRASTDTLAPSVLQRCLEAAALELAPKGSLTNDIGIERLIVTQKEKVVVLAAANKTPVVMRIPLSDAALSGCQKNIQALRALHQAGCASVAPLPVADGCLAGYYCAIESRMSGRPMRSMPRVPSDLALIESLIRNLNPNALAREIDDQLFEQLVSTPLRKVAAVTGALDSERTVEMFFRSRLRGRRITLGITHGDLSLSNVFVKGDALTGVIDWDDSCLTGIPVLDAISHLCSRQFRRSGNFSQTFIGLAARRWPKPEELSFLDRCYEHFRTDPGIHGALVFLYWLRLVDRQLDFRSARESAVARARLHEVTRAIVRQTSAAAKAAPRTTAWTESK